MFYLWNEISQQHLLQPHLFLYLQTRLVVVVRQQEMEKAITNVLTHIRRLEVETAPKKVETSIKTIQSFLNFAARGRTKCC